jgi:hypothetical protein
MSNFDISRKCVKCGKKGHLHRHHVIYKPVIMADLCPRCHKVITLINTLAAQMFQTNKKTKVKMTNVVRLSLWRAFINAN